MRVLFAMLVCLAVATGCGGHQGDALVAANREPAAAVKATAAPDSSVEKRVEGQKVAATLRLARSRAKVGETIELSVQLHVAPLWEVRTLDSEFPGAATKLELELPAGIVVQSDWQAPQPEPSLSGDGHPAYAGEVTFTRKVTVEDAASPGERPIKCRIRYQACNEQRCLAPADLELAIMLMVE